MTTVDEKLQRMFVARHGECIQRIHVALTACGLKAKDNNKTVLYYFGKGAKGNNSLAAMRDDPLRVFSFPKSYWQERRNELNLAISSFGMKELSPPNASSPSEKESAQQILINDETVDRILEVVRNHIAPRIES